MTLIKTIILPGYSEYNRMWAYEAKENLKLGHEILVHEWRHWKDKSLSFNLKKELEAIFDEIGNSNINILAKSVGTYVAMKLLQKVKNKIIKIILCGIPSVSKVRKQIYLKALNGFPPNNIISFQNANDPFASYQEVKNFIKEIDSRIKVIEKPGKDHNYPYFTDFEDFLRG